MRLPPARFYSQPLAGPTLVGLSPEMALSSSVNGAIADAGTDALGNRAATVAVDITYTISNTGNKALTLTTVAAPGGLVNCTASILTQPDLTVQPGGTKTMVVRVTPSAAGAFSCTVSITNDDSDENPYNWTISGTGT